MDFEVLHGIRAYPWKSNFGRPYLWLENSNSRLLGGDFGLLLKLYNLAASERSLDSDFGSYGRLKFRDSNLRFVLQIAVSSHGFHHK